MDLSRLSVELLILTVPCTSRLESQNPLFRSCLCASTKRSSPTYASIRPGSRSSARTRARRSGLRLSNRSEEHTSELQSQSNLVCRLLLEKKKKEKIDVVETTIVSY